MSIHAASPLPKPSAAILDLLDRPMLTPPICVAYPHILKAVTLHDTAVSFVAPSGFGKTSAIEVLTDQLSANLPSAPVLRTIAKNHDRFSEAKFFAEMLEGCTCALAPRGQAGALRNRLIRFFWELVESKGSDRIALFVDEAQSWTQPEFNCLRDISKDLILLADVHLIVILFGGPDLAKTRDALLNHESTEQIGQFLGEQNKLQGIASEIDLMQTIRCYDNIHAPLDQADISVKSHSEAFMPVAFADGWRLESEAPILWERFQTVATRHGGVREIGMKWIASTVRNFLIRQHEWDRTGFRGDPEAWEEAILESGFPQTIGYLHGRRVRQAAKL
ncbi:ATP-binding protein [Massilia horti]|uniref:ATP-binding protein n=1 Tax=Massilia horti TaxID=2562153 RepID=A0A4Y9T2E8_9BURK|nr:ATP-binding protein [Massilia horti]TFW31776.1 ATP-binding protein [Massilia horti]